MPSEQRFMQVALGYAVSASKAAESCAGLVVCCAWGLGVRI